MASFPITGRALEPPPGVVTELEPLVGGCTVEPGASWLDEGHSKDTVVVFVVTLATTDPGDRAPPGAVVDVTEGLCTLNWLGGRLVGLGWAGLLGGAVLALTVVTVGLDICMTRGFGVGLVTPWVVAVGFPMLLVTVGLVPAGDLGGWEVGEDRKGLVDAFNVVAGSPEPPGSALTWLNGFLGAGAGVEAEGFSLFGVVRVTTRTPGAVGLVRNGFLGRAATTTGWVCAGLDTPVGVGILVVGLLDGELPKKAWRDVGVTVVLGLAPVPMGELLGKSIMVSIWVLLVGEVDLGEMGFPGEVVGLISVWTGVFGVFGVFGDRAEELGGRRGTVSPDSDAADANRLLPLTPPEPEAALVTFDPEVGLGLPLLVLLVELCCREKRHNKYIQTCITTTQLGGQFHEQ